MANPDASSEIPVDLKKRARRRLVGAIALALLAIIVLPMVMDHEPKPANQDIQIRIPSQETDTQVLRAPTGQSATSSATATVAPIPDAIPAKLDEKPPADSKGELKPPTDSPQQTTANTAAVTAAVKPTEKPVPEKSEPAHSTDEAHALSVLNGTGDQWLVRLGAYQNTGNVKQLLAKVKEAGIPAYAEKFDSPKGPRTRVLAGPFGSREAAEKAQVRIKKIGVDGTVIAKQ